MIRVLGPLAPPAPRLIETLRERGHAVDARFVSGAADVGGARIDRDRSEVVLALGPGTDPAALRSAAVRPAADAPPTRLLVLSLVGTHPDARSPLLQSLWSLEETARATGLEVLTLRLAPLIGPRSPLWLKLRTRPPLPRGGRKLLNPVLEEDAVETLERAITGRAGWHGWYEVAGEEPVALAELAAWARTAGRGEDPGAWEPALDVLEDQKLCDPDPWRAHFGIEPSRVSMVAREWAA